jgi:hypothetical protein
MRRRDRFSISSIRLADLGGLERHSRLKLIGRLYYDARFAPLGQDRPRDARQALCCGRM